MGGDRLPRLCDQIFTSDLYHFYIRFVPFFIRFFTIFTSDFYHFSSDCHVFVIILVGPFLHQIFTIFHQIFYHFYIRFFTTPCITFLCISIFLKFVQWYSVSYSGSRAPLFQSTFFEKL